ncbi:MAG TPA: response regulator, partial [Verrucomicrobiae bacterium]|nr:response regulator [Verrucomicrobiae bacterium]
MTEPTSSPSSVRILHLEDNAHDHLLVREMLAAEGLSCDFALARSRPEFEAALQRGPYDLIISDYTLPAYDGLEALSLVRRLQIPMPFIFFSGTIGEEIAVESLKTGATDYVIKQRPQRLVSAVRRALREAVEMTERKHAEEKIREQAALLDKAHDAIIVCDLDGRIIFWNRSAERIYGWSASEAAGRRVGQILFDQIPLSFREARKSVAERGEWRGEFQQITKDEQPVMVQSSWTLVRDTEGRPKSELIINTDITEQKQLEEKFLRAQRLESLGALVSGIAHDLNNALVPVIAGAGLLRTMPLPEPAAEILKTMTASARRGANMVQQILTFARGGEGRKSLLHVNQLVNEMGKIITDMFPKSIQCRVRTGVDCWPVHGLPTQLHQVIMNLCINARDAMPAGGTLTLATQNTVIHEAQAARHRGAAPGRYLCLSVNDTGLGIPQDQLTKIFQPFFTTKAPGQGTGLGLSTSLTIVKNHGGFMTVQSPAGNGTEFKVYLPAIEPPEAPEPTPVTAALPAGNGEGVLIVDDEAAILALSKTTLENYRYRVRTAASGPEAVAIFNAERNALSLVITNES